MSRPSVVEWLYACFLVRRAAASMNFSKRQAFYKAIRPRIDVRSVVEYPDAWMLIRLADVRRGIDRINSMNQPRPTAPAQEQKETK